MKEQHSNHEIEKLVKKTRFYIIRETARRFSLIFIKSKVQNRESLAEGDELDVLTQIGYKPKKNI